MLSAFTLGAAICFGAAAMAGDLPKEGTYNGTYISYGTYKATPIGKERLLLVFDENALQMTNGFSDHTTWHCWGLGDFTDGMGDGHGYCVATDPAGDQFAVSWRTDKHAMGQGFSGSGTIIAGTGKFAGVSGGHTFVYSGNDFRTATEGTYAGFANIQGNYKLP
jgi:hypothetical protein